MPAHVFASSRATDGYRWRNSKPHDPRKTCVQKNGATTLIAENELDRGFSARGLVPCTAAMPCSS